MTRDEMGPALALAERPARPTPDLPPLPVALAPAVQEGRRRLGMDVAALASAARVDERDVRGIEDGATTGGPVARAVLAALGVDPAPLLPGTPQGPVPVAPVDQAHARSLTYLRDAARSEPGWLLSPDVAARAAAAGWSDGVLSDARARDEATPHAAWRLGKWWGACTLPLLPAWVALDWLTDAISTHGDAMAGGLLASVLLPAVGGLLMYHAAESYGPLHGEVERLEAEGDRIGALRSVLAAVSGRGLVTYAATRDGLVRREYLATSVTSAEVVDEDAGHVTLRLRTLVGDVKVPWVPRVRDVTDLVSSWGAGGSRVRLEGPQ